MNVLSSPGRGRDRAARSLSALALALTVLAGSPLQAADTLRVKLATLVPTGSVYHKSLLALREQWRKLSNGSVDLVLYADGKLGGEADVVRLMGLNSVQAAMLTAVGLSEIEPAVEGLQSIPMGFRSLDEVDYVREQLESRLDERLAAKGFVVLGWSDAGWVRFFCRTPVVVPDDLRKLKLFTWAGRPESVEVYKSAGFNAMPLETADIVPSLETGLIDAVPVIPVYALTAQLDRRAPHMIELDWAPLVGAVVVRKATWERIPAALRDPLREAARHMAIEIKTNGRKEAEEAVKAMENRGLKVTRPTTEQVAQWRTAAEATYPRLRGRLLPADVFDETLRLLQEYRDRHP